MKTQRTNSFVLILCIAMIAISGCKESSSTTNPTGTSLTGTLVYDIPSGDNNIGMYSFSSQSASVAFKDGHCPTWMPNGEVLYEVPTDLLPDVEWKIATIAQNGTNKKVLLDSKMYNSKIKKSPKMSKDGQTICFNYWKGGTGGPEIHNSHATLFMKADGTFLFAIDSLFDGTWLPNGSIILSATIDEINGERTLYPEGLYIVAADLSTIVTIGTGLVKPKHPAASPDGKRVAFSMNGHIWVINIDGTGLRQVTTGTKLETSPCWSPDGKYIACSSYGVFESSSYSAIAAVPADNATVIDLVNSSSYWVKDVSQSSNITQGRLTISSSISWK